MRAGLEALDGEPTGVLFHEYNTRTSAISSGSMSTAIPHASGKLLLCACPNFVAPSTSPATWRNFATSVSSVMLSALACFPSSARFNAIVFSPRAIVPTAWTTCAESRPTPIHATTNQPNPGGAANPPSLFSLTLEAGNPIEYSFVCFTASYVRGPNALREEQPRCSARTHHCREPEPDHENRRRSSRSSSRGRASCAPRRSPRFFSPSPKPTSPRRGRVDLHRLIAPSATFCFVSSMSVRMPGNSPPSSCAIWSFDWDLNFAGSTREAVGTARRSRGAACRARPSWLGRAFSIGSSNPTARRPEEPSVSSARRHRVHLAQHELLDCLLLRRDRLVVGLELPGDGLDRLELGVADALAATRKTLLLGLHFGGTAIEHHQCRALQRAFERGE